MYNLNTNLKQNLSKTHNLFHKKKKEIKNELIMTHFQCLVEIITQLENLNVILRNYQNLLLIQNII